MLKRVLTLSSLPSAILLAVLATPQENALSQSGGIGASWNGAQIQSWTNFTICRRQSWVPLVYTCQNDPNHKCWDLQLPPFVSVCVSRNL